MLNVGQSEQRALSVWTDVWKNDKKIERKKWRWLCMKSSLRVCLTGVPRMIPRQQISFLVDSHETVLVARPGAALQ